MNYNQYCPSISEYRTILQKIRNKEFSTIEEENSALTNIRILIKKCIIEYISYCRDTENNPSVHQKILNDIQYVDPDWIEKVIGIPSYVFDKFSCTEESKRYDKFMKQINSDN